MSLEPSPEAAMIEVPPTPGGDVVIEGRPVAAIRAREGGMGSMGEPDVDRVLLGVEGDAVDPPGRW
jgi:hypothetical protein